MNILICDNMPEEAAELNALLQDSGFQVHTNQFHHAPDVLDFIRTGTLVDLCFLDIVMPEMNGIKLAEALRQSGYAGEIVFLSTSKEYGPESYTVGAFSYLLKPPTSESVRDVLFKLEQSHICTDQAELWVDISGRKKGIQYRNISYVEVIRHVVYFRMTDGGEVGVNATFSEIAAELLLDPRFIQCHRSFVVNMQDIDEISEREIVTRSGTRIAISRTYRNTRNKFYKWKFRKGHTDE
ncbi:response regulator transcription factor [Aminipila butyrica]|uniref:Stage 0 sporulation protein A homolog n=1 Tax=Aminipila butyrica TaxID=433296 RepID=A0A858BSA9_9FIRM|nr:LytTR family DNA-binding domain-containing protein [Aminipila butyrica]QIB68793.1 response regulator transcription factor [Aminipila butyrica]